MDSELVRIVRRDPDDEGLADIKDPCVIALPDGTFELYATVRSLKTQTWDMGRFRAAHPGGPWHEAPPPRLSGVSGPEVCAPSVVYDVDEKGPRWTMYVQTSCFHENGVIARAVSRDGENFTGLPEPVMTKEDLAQAGYEAVGLYDAAVSGLDWNGRSLECLVFSAYRKVGSGDVYVSLREKGGEWSLPELVLKQEDVPFHNRPGGNDFEWGLEGAKIVQLAPDAYMMIGVCFLDGGERGTRQRVFMAAAPSPLGPFLPMNMPLAPTPYDQGCGENGHPDTIDLGDRLGILYQERAGEGKLWHLRYAEIDKDELLMQVRARLNTARPFPRPLPRLSP